MSPWLKAGLIGAAVLIVLSLFSIIPIVGFVACILMLLAYIGIGVLAAYWMPPLREAGAAAGQGALAATLAAFIGGIANTIVSTIQWSLVDASTVLDQMPAESIQQMQEAGLDPTMFTGPGVGAICGSVCCLVGLILAAILGAVGGAIFAGLKPD